ncbi:MAG TPA: sugar-transfer associated ATP-grasp domain-containing protein [Stellaceae bacterium]|nr:sugar-transfer associated ATP-grasp domain-containing protein [Stellaceae bacterium]
MQTALKSNSEHIEASESAPQSLAVEKPQAALQLAPALRKLAAESGSSYFKVLREYMRLAMGPGQLSFPEYMVLRAIQSEFPPTAETKAFVGIKAARTIWAQANFRSEFYEILNSKIASTALLAAYGLPTIPTLALYCTRAGVASPTLMRTEEALREFLTDERNYPLFGKPLDGEMSLGSASLAAYRRTDDRVIDIAGKTIALGDYIADLTKHYGGGYLFQRRVSPHTMVRDICGDRLATVRVLTILSEGKPRILRACWKIPAGENGADNFWRPDNLLAQLDRETGHIQRVIRRTADGIEEIARHPDSGAPLVGTLVPSWRAVTEAALEAAKVLPDVALIGWDVAPVDAGAVIVEPNHTPDLMLHQLADRRGILDADLRRFLDERKQLAVAWNQEQKRRVLTKAAAEMMHR